MIVYKPQEFAKKIGVSVRTLQRWDNDGRLKANRTAANRRFYTDEQLPNCLKKLCNDTMKEQSTGTAKNRISTTDIMSDIIDKIYRDMYKPLNLKIGFSEWFVKVGFVKIDKDNFVGAGTGYGFSNDLVKIFAKYN
jgi:hypothetical protein